MNLTDLDIVIFFITRISILLLQLGKENDLFMYACEEIEEAPVRRKTYK